MLFFNCVGLLATSWGIDKKISKDSYFCYYIRNTNTNSYYCLGSYRNILSTGTDLSNNVTIQPGTKIIADQAFYYDTNSFQGTLSIPTSVVYIGESSFYACSKITSIIFNTSITNLKEIGSYCFANCSSLGTLEWEKLLWLQKIGEHAFYSCSKLSSITLCSNVGNNVGTYAFQNCSSLNSITMSSFQSYPNWPTTSDGYSYIFQNVAASGKIKVQGTLSAASMLELFKRVHKLPGTWGT